MKSASIACGLTSLSLLSLLSLLSMLACTRVAEPDPSAPVIGESTMTAPSSAAPPHDTALEAALTRIAAEQDGHVAVSVRNLTTGAYASVNGDRRMPMMSVFKLPIAVVALMDVDAGTRHLDEHVPIAADELRPTVSPIAEAWAKGEHAPTLETLLTRVIQDSDNTAGDKLFTLLGGESITARLRARGLEGISIARQEIDIAADLECAGAPKPPSGWTDAAVAACPRAPLPAQRAAAQREIDASPNSASADALVELLARLERGDLVSPASTQWLRATLAGTHTGQARLRALLPAGTPVGHKTGTGDVVDGVNIATNDVGVVTMPSGDRFAIAVLTAGSTADQATREATIARLGRAAWDAFTPAIAKSP